MDLTKSEELYQRAIKVIPGATQTLSKGADRFVKGVTPKYLSYGRNAHVWDVDGNEFIDWPMGLGAILLGYSTWDMYFDRGLQGALHEGSTFTLPHPSEVDLAEKLVEIIPCAEMVRFCKNGSDATEGAIRIARAVTGKKHVAMCMPGYHGSHDWSAVTGGLRRGLIDDGYVHTFKHNDLHSLADTLHNFDCAAVIMEQGLEEPEKDHHGNFLQKAYSLARSFGALFILDEIVTGFRYALGGAQQLYNVSPDLACFGKAMANGLPISAIVGKKEYMETLNDGVFFSFTFAGDTVAIASALKTIEIIQREDVIKQLWLKGAKLRIGIQTAAEEVKLKINLRGNAVRSVLEILGEDGKPDRIAYSLFLQETIKRGILFGVPIFPCWTHTDEDIEKTVEAVGEAFAFIKQVQESGKSLEIFLEGEPIAPPVIRA